MKAFNILAILSILVLVFGACKKDSNQAAYTYNVRMTDGPGPYNAVYIDLRSVEITGGDNKTVVLNVNPGIYNLLNFSNGVDTLIATGNLNDANVQQIRLILGPNNSVVVNNISYPLKTPSAEQSGLKLNVNHTLQAGILYSVLLDFDANKSIVETGNGDYILKPVIRTVEAAISGSIKGNITPVGTLAFVTALSSTNITYTAAVNAAGNFQLVGVPAGTYTVTVTPALPLSPVSKTNVTVTTGNVNNIGTIAL
jgi:hypothetical protein